MIIIIIMIKLPIDDANIVVVKLKVVITNPVVAIISAVCFLKEVVGSERWGIFSGSTYNTVSLICIS